MNRRSIADRIYAVLTTILLLVAGGCGIWGWMEGCVRSAWENERLGVVMIGVAALMSGVVAGIWLIRFTEVDKMCAEFDRIRSDVARTRDALAREKANAVAFEEGLAARTEEASALRARVVELESEMDALQSEEHRIRAEFDRLRPRERESLARMLWVSEDFDCDYAVTQSGIDTGTLAVLTGIGAVIDAGERTLDGESSRVYVLDPRWQEWLAAHRDRLPDIDRASA